MVLCGCVAAPAMIRECGRWLCAHARLQPVMQAETGKMGAQGCTWHPGMHSMARPASLSDQRERDGHVCISDCTHLSCKLTPGKWDAGLHLASAGNAADGQICIWDCSTWSLLSRHHRQHDVRSLAFCGPTLLSAGQAHVKVRWGLSTLERLISLICKATLIFLVR